MKDKKILILGGKGKTGRRVAKRLTMLGYKNIRIGSEVKNRHLIGKTRKLGQMQLMGWTRFILHSSPI